ncbi:MAG: response regulator [Verrucomicrobiota bacterium]
MAAKRDLRLEPELKKLDRHQVVILDDIGYVQQSREEMEVLGEFENPENSPRPALILLDLNMPGTDGREVLAILKQDEVMKKIPVLVLITSTDERDIRKCYEAGANSYVQKPVNRDGFMDAVQRLTDFWFQLALIPKAYDE